MRGKGSGRPRAGAWRGLVATLAAGSMLALAACGGGDSAPPSVADATACLKDQGYYVHADHVNAASRKSGTTASLTVLTDDSGQTAADEVVNVYFWDSESSGASYVKSVGTGPLDDLKHQQLGQITVTYIKTAKGIDSIVGCMA